MRNIRPQATSSIVVLVVTLLGVWRDAQAEERDISLVRVSTQGWVWVPTTVGSSVESFVGLRTGPATGENITAVWYRRVPDGGWQAWAWGEQDQSKAIAIVKSELGLPSSTDSSWPLAPSVELSEMPERLTMGVLASDPLAPVLADMAEPAPLVEALEAVGWRAAWVDVWDYECADIAVLDVWSDAVECEATSGLAERRIRRVLNERGCNAAATRELIWVWVEEYWTSFDAGSPISFDGIGLGVHPDWHPLDEAVQEFESRYPGVPISEAVYGGTWGTLTLEAQRCFRNLSLTLDYQSFSTGKVRAPGNPYHYPAEPTPPAGGPDCDHQAFYSLIKQLMRDMPWTDVGLGGCLYQDEGWLETIFRCPRFDCDDFADTIGSCLLSRLAGHGYSVIGRNMKVILKCPSGGSIGHGLFAIYYCGYWYIIDGGAWDHPIGIVPGSPGEPVLLNGGVAAWLRAMYAIGCEEFGVVPAGEWEPGDGPMIEPARWYTSPAEVARVVGCLRSGGLSDQEIAEALGCAIPAGQLQQVNEWIVNPPGQSSPLGGVCHPMHP